MNAEQTEIIGTFAHLLRGPTEDGRERMTWRPCLKQTTRCVVVLEDGTKIEGVNRCDVQTTAGVQECPRVTAGCATGEGYDLCGPPRHAETEAAALIPDDNVGGKALLFGHNWFCGPCQWALSDKGIKTFIITGKPA